VAVGLYVYFVVRPTEDALPPQDDIATLWSESVSRLGIEPLFPPQEDFHVGDVYVVISAYDDEDGVTREKGPDRPLLRKSAKIGYINLRDISMGTPEAPVFAPTRMNDAGDRASLNQQREEVVYTPEAQRAVDARIKVSVVSFPAITVRSSTGSGASWDDWLPLSASRTLANEEVITIKSAESYGASTVEATLALNKWCNEPKTRLACTDAFARKILGYTTNSKVLDVRNNKYVYRISLKLVTQVYLMREIDFKRTTDGGVNASMGRYEAKDEGASDEAKANAGPVAEPAANEQQNSNSIRHRRFAGTTMAIGNVTYPRPVVFGFKSVTFSLEPSMPTSEPEQ
jgi:hypothetical protein